MSGMQSDVAPVSSGSAARLTRYFSAPGFNTGPAGAGAPAAAPRPRPPPPPPNPAHPYTPEKSILPSRVRGSGLLADAAAVVSGAAVTGVVPGIVTVTDLVTAPTVSVYVVVALGVTRIWPRGATRPTVGAM